MITEIREIAAVMVWAAYTRNFPKKFIPIGTRFLVSYTGGDISKPVIVGREFDDEIEEEIVDTASSEEE